MVELLLQTERFEADSWDEFENTSSLLMSFGASGNKPVSRIFHWMWLQTLYLTGNSKDPVRGKARAAMPQSCSHGQLPTIINSSRVRVDVQGKKGRPVEDALLEPVVYIGRF